MYPFEHFSLWTDPKNHHLLRFFYDKTETELGSLACAGEYTELRTQLFQTTYTCSWCMKERPISHKRAPYLELLRIACNPMKYLVAGDLIMCYECALDDERPPIHPISINWFRVATRPRVSFVILKRALKNSRLEWFNQVIVNNSANFHPNVNGYYLMISNYTSDDSSVTDSDVKARARNIETLHPRYQVGSSLFDILYSACYHHLILEKLDM